MATQVLTSLVDIDTRGVCLEVLIDRERDFLRTKGHQISLDLRDILRNSVGGRESVLVAGVSSLVGGLGVAGLLAGRGGVAGQARALNIGGLVVVVLAGRVGVSPAPRVVLVVATSDSTSGGQPVPSLRRVSTVASRTA
jgi:hypothetical protein